MELPTPAGAQPAQPDSPAQPAFATYVNRLSVVILIVAMAAAIGLRVMRLDQVPPGLNQDEACNGYDAYSILTTGRDQHGNFMPLAIQAFNDYRMPLFDYSLVPFVAALGLTPASIRLDAALWGIVDLAAIATLAGLLWGWPGAALAMVLGAFSPWHLPFSRFAHEAITASATVDLAMAAFFLWVRRRRNYWLLLSGAGFGLALYAYAITKAFVPLMILYLGLLYWRDLVSSRRAAAGAIALAFLIALPQGVMLLRHTAAMQARFLTESVFNTGASRLGQLGLVGANFASYFGPAFLFLRGTVGEGWPVHPPGFGQLLREQAFLIVIGLIALLVTQPRHLALLAGWLVMASLPAAMMMPAAHSQRDVLAFAPWILLSAAGFAALLEAGARFAPVRLGLAAIVFTALIVDGARFARVYFRDYPLVAERYYWYGMDQVVQQIGELGNYEDPVVITPTNQGYILVLFFEAYPPDLFQRLPVKTESGLSPRVANFGRYWFIPPEWVYGGLPHGIFVFDGSHLPPAPPAATVRYLDGTTAYNIVVK
jgi:hypothetical protein